MKNLKGFIDPVSLSLILIFSIVATGVVTGTKATDEGTMAQTSQDQAEQVAPATKGSGSVAYN